MGLINGYKLIGELSAQNAGFCQWGFCEKDGREYFIKEFLTPVYPSDSVDLSKKVMERKRKICEDFYTAKKEYYDVLGCCRTGNIILIQDFFRSGSKYYTVTDKVNSDGTDPSIISQLTREKKETLIRSLLFSIAKLHDVGIVHADIKPDNILLKKTRDGFYTAKIIDFDAGFLLEKQPAEIQGDFIYLSPEVYLKMNEEDVKLSEKIDIFALGILFHQYWTGELPKLGADYRYVFEAVLDGSEVQLSNDIPLYLRTIISRMLSVDPLSRPSAHEILEMYKAEVLAHNPSPPITSSIDSSTHDTPSTDSSSFDLSPKDSPSDTPAKVSSGFYIPGDLD